MEKINCKHLINAWACSGFFRNIPFFEDTHDFYYTVKKFVYLYIFKKLNNLIETTGILIRTTRKTCEERSYHNFGDLNQTFLSLEYFKTFQKKSNNVRACCEILNNF